MAHPRLFLPRSWHLGPVSSVAGIPWKARGNLFPLRSLYGAKGEITGGATRGERLSRTCQELRKGG